MPAERQKFIAEDSNARFILSSSRLSSFDLFGSNVLDIDDPVEKASILAESTDELQVAGPENLSYLLYTSGMLVVSTLLCVRGAYHYYVQELLGPPRDVY